MMQELREIEEANIKLREDKMMNLLLEAQSKKKVKKIPPPLVPLPYHQIPKKIIDDLKIEPPLAAQINLKGNFDEDRLSRKRSKMLEKMYPTIEVFERKEVKNAETKS